MSEYFPKPKSLGANVKIELDFSNYKIKADFKNEAGINTLKFVKKVDLASLKFDVDKLDIYKLKTVPSNFSNLRSKVDKLDVDNLVPVPVHLSKLSDVVKMILIKNIYIMLRSKILKIKCLILLI